MAREFYSSNESLRRDEAVVSSPPFTFAGWVYLNSITAGVICGVYYSASTGNWHSLRYASTPQTFRAESRSVDTYYAQTTTTYGTGSWIHVAGVWASNSNRKIYSEGNLEDTNTTSCTPSNLNRTSLGIHGDSSPSMDLDGRLAEVAIWDAALNDDEIAILAKGYSPLFIRPQNLKAYWPLIRKGASVDNPDFVGGFNLSDVNTPEDAEHCRIIHPAGPIVCGISGGGGLKVSVLAEHYRKMRVA